MKIPLLGTYLLFFAGASIRAEAPTVSVAEPVVSGTETLTASDLGIRKVIFEATPTAGQVVTIRMEEFRNGKLEETMESIADTMNARVRRESLTLIDLSVFREVTPEQSKFKSYRFTGVFSGNIQVQDAAMRHYGAGSHNSLQVEFDTPRGPLKYIFTIFTEAYDVAKKRSPELPAMRPDAGWTQEADYPAARP